MPEDVNRMTEEELREEVLRLRGKMQQMCQILQDDIQRAAREQEMALGALKKAEQNSNKGMGR